MAVFGTAQVIFAWLIEWTGNRSAPIWYVVAMNLISVAATLALRIDAPDPKEVAHNEQRYSGG